MSLDLRAMWVCHVLTPAGEHELPVRVIRCEARNFGEGELNKSILGRAVAAGTVQRAVGRAAGDCARSAILV